MSREIKFREWNPRGECWIEFGTTDYAFKDGILNLAEEDSDCVLEQYTGLKDTNGKEIYEGDIVGDYYDEEEVGYVVFEEGGYCVNWSMINENLDEGLADTLIIIGNIHENPELLKPSNSTELEGKNA